MTVFVRTQQALVPDHFTTRLLEYPVYELRLDGLSEGGVEALWQSLQQQVGGARAMAYAKVSVQDLRVSARLAALGWQLVDTNVQLEKKASPLYPRSSQGVTFRFAGHADKEPVAKLARTAFSATRWHRDEMISRLTADAIKEAWVRNFWSGERGDYMIVAEVQSRIVGFHQVVRQDDVTLLVDLLAVDENFRGRAIGTGLLEYASQHCGPVGRMLVGTQLANRASLGMYHKSGFQIISARHIWHVHLPIGQVNDRL